MRLLAIGVCLLFVPACLLGGTVINFDSGLTSDGAIPNGYGGLDWYNFSALDATTLPNSGYYAGMVSPDFVAYNNYGDDANVSSGTPFTFTSVDLTAAWNDGLSIDITGYVSGTPTYTQTVNPIATAATLYTFNWSGLDEVSFHSYGGTPHPGYDGSGTHLGMDNLTINGSAAVPEPATWLLLGAAMLAAGALRRKRS